MRVDICRLVQRNLRKSNSLACLRTRVVAAAFVGLFLIASDRSNAQQAPPTIDADIHLGVASCAGSTCHGSVEAWTKSTVLQNEYVTWQREDAHAKAYNVLFNEDSKRIARNLGLAEAHTAEVCLTCHSDYVAPERRGATFQISDGVGCEACHGGSVRWLGVHLSRKGHKVNVESGMYPTDEPVARAELCLSCHLGDESRFVTHRIMGAGHPRLRFELDTFTALQPAHFEIDDDYIERKKVFNGVQTWAIGQAIAVKRTIALLVNPKHAYDGIFPELVFFDCHACHHPMSNKRWQPRIGTQLPPGIVRINDANMIMLRVVAKHFDADLGAQLMTQTLALHAASTRGQEATVGAAKALQTTAEQLVDLLSSRTFEASDIEALALGIVAEGLAGEFADYAAAEQATMALASVIETMAIAGLIDTQQREHMNSAIEACYAAVEKDEQYTPIAYAECLDQFATTLPDF